LSKASKKYIAGVILAVIILAGLFFRSYGLGYQSLWINEAFTVNAAMAVAADGYPMLGSGNIYTNNLVSVYFTALMMKTLPFDPYDPWALRLPAVLFGTGLIFLVYIFAKRAFKDRQVSIMAAFIVAFSYNELVFSRQVRGYAAFAFLFVLAMYLLLRYLDDRKKKHLIWAGVLLTLSCLSHWVGLATIPAIITIIIIYRKPAIALTHPSRGKIILTSLILLTLISSASIILLTLYRKDAIVRYIIFPILPFLAILIAFYWRKLINIITTNRTRAFRLSFYCLSLILVASPFLSFVPRNYYELNLYSPQPNFSEAFSVIKSGEKSGDIVISSHPLLHHIYLDEDGMWLPVGISAGGMVDYYTGLSPINTYTDLKGIVEGGHGFILIDGQAFHSSSSNRIGYIENTPQIRLIYQSGDKPQDMLWLYRF